MGFPEDLLADDEQVVYHLHPHWKMLFLPVVWLLLIGGGAGFLAAIAPHPYLQLGIVVVAFLAICYTTLRPFIKWASTHFVLTTHRVMLRTGVINRTGRDVPLARVNDVSFQHTLLERLIFRCGTLVVESAGEHGQVMMTDIPKVEKVQSTLYQLVEDYAEGQGTSRVAGR